MWKKDRQLYRRSSNALGDGVYFVSALQCQLKMIKEGKNITPDTIVSMEAKSNQQ